jgi:hypothetical protein
MSSKTVTVSLYRPDGGIVREFNNVEVTHYDKNSITFTKRVEDVGEDTATVYDYTSNLPYLVTETVTGPKNLI